MGNNSADIILTYNTTSLGPFLSWGNLIFNVSLIQKGETRDIRSELMEELSTRISRSELEELL